MGTETARFEVIENSGPNNLRDVLKVKLAEASEVHIAVAFLTESGLAEIIQPLRQVAARGHVRLVTGLYQRVTEPGALKLLLRIQYESHGHFLVRLSREPQFHRKLYLLENRTRAAAIVGSSILTREGLRSGGELDLVVLLPRGAPSYKRLRSAFEKDWHESRAVALTDERVERYERVRRISAVTQKPYSRGELREILGKETSHEQAKKAEGPVNTWRDCITGFVKKRTERIISEVTNWDTKHYFWYSTGGPHPYQMGCRIFLFDLTAKRFDLVEVKDWTRTAVRTPDGRHFIAYRQVHGYGRRFSDKLWRQLEALHIRKNDLRGTRKVGATVAAQLAGILRVRKNVG